MSRQNKVNPGMYTQRGRLTQDDAARELKRQRSIGSEHTWQPSKKDHFPRLTSNRHHEALGAETSGDNEGNGATPAAVNAKPAARVNSAPPKTTQSKTAKSMAAKKTAGKPKAAKTAKRRSAKIVRKAVLARNVGAGGAKPRTTAKRRKS